MKPPQRNAYREARVVRPGCQHNLGCRCDPPYWLRESSAEERRIEAKIRNRKEKSK